MLVHVNIFFLKKICYKKIFYIKITKKPRERANFLPVPPTVQLYVINCTTLCYQLYNSMLSTVQLYVINCTTHCCVAPKNPMVGGFFDPRNQDIIKSIIKNIITHSKRDARGWARVHVIISQLF